MGSDAPARKTREGESLDTPTREASEGGESHDTPTREAREGEESPDARVLEGEEASYQLPDFAGLLRQLFTPLHVVFN